MEIALDKEGNPLCPKCKEILEEFEEGDICPDCWFIACPCPKCDKEDRYTSMYLVATGDADNENEAAGKVAVNAINFEPAVDAETKEKYVKDDTIFYWYCPICGSRDTSHCDPDEEGDEEGDEDDYDDYDDYEEVEEPKSEPEERPHKSESKVSESKRHATSEDDKPKKRHHSRSPPRRKSPPPSRSSSSKSSSSSRKAGHGS